MEVLFECAVRHGVLPVILMHQCHDDNLSDTMCRYFVTELLVVGRQGNTKSICHTMFFCGRST